MEDEVKITFPVDFRGKVKGNSNPNPSRGFSHASQIYRENVLRGSQFLSKPSLLFNGAVYNEKTLYNGAMVASTQEVNQGLMFYWEDFINPDPRIKEGDMVTFSVDVRSTGEDIPTGAVAFKGTSNFEDYYKSP
ncbi:tail fiber protein [Enterococcus phage EF-P10]|nr:tail fiber protein [Enterococcus phage EF-P10]